MGYGEFRQQYGATRCPWSESPQARRSKPQGRIVAWSIAGVVLVTVAIVAAARAAHGAVDHAAVVKLESANSRGQCSGVIVTRDGVILTAQHCDNRGDVQVEFRDGSRSTARIVFAGNKGAADDVVALRLPPGDYPAAAIAATRPRDGELVWSFGYPSDSLEPLTGTVQRIGFLDDPHETPVVMTTIPTRAGHSGGPLFNLAGEVCGIASFSKDAKVPQRVERAGDSGWISLERIRAAMTAAVADQQFRRRGELLAFSGSRCAPCQQFRDDVAANVDGITSAISAVATIVFLSESEPAEWSKYAGEFTAATGREIKTVPTFWFRGGRTYFSGYDGPKRFKQWLAINATTTPPAVEPQRFAVPPLPVPAVEPQEPAGAQIDWSAAKIVVLRSNEGLSDTARGLLKLGKDTIGGPIRRKLNTLTGSRADVELIHQQLEPQRFATVEAAIGRPAGKFLVCVLVREQDLNIVRGLIAKRVTSALEDYVRSFPVEVVSQRAHPQDFAAIESALATVEPAENTPRLNWWQSAIAAIVAAAVGYFGARYRKTSALPATRTAKK